MSLLTLAGRMVIDHALDRLAEASVATVLVTPGGRKPIESHLAARGDDPATSLLGDIGGQLGFHAGVFLIEGDVAWFDGPATALARLADGFDPDRFDGMLLLARVTDLDAGVEREALALDPLGYVRRPDELEIAPFVFAGVQLLSTPVLETAGLAGIRAVWDRAIASGRLGGLVHDGVWFSLRTVREVEAARHSFEDRMAGIRL